MVTRVNLQHNPKTDHAGISSYFIKSPTNGGSKTNKQCSTYLGITIAEKILSKIFKNVKVFPYGHKFYDFIYNNGYMIDVKASCKRKGRYKAWYFDIKHNKIANYFLCLAFDSRQSLNPKHIWLIPGEKINHLGGLSISESKLPKWEPYELTNKLNDVIACCNILRM